MVVVVRASCRKGVRTASSKLSSHIKTKTGVGRQQVKAVMMMMVMMVTESESVSESQAAVRPRSSLGAWVGVGVSVLTCALRSGCRGNERNAWVMRLGRCEGGVVEVE